MEREALLTGRIALYRRYLAEGANSDIACAYLSCIRQDEAELAAIAERRKRVSGAAGSSAGDGTR